MFLGYKKLTVNRAIYLLLVFWVSGAWFSPLLAEAGSANSARVTGTVIDETSHAPIASANIYFRATSIGASSDQNGRFVIEAALIGQTELVISHIGYQTKAIPLHLKSGETKKLNILLMPKIIKLEEVTFTASRHVETVFRSQMNVAIATRDRIAMRTSPNTADALREISGILVQKTTAGHGAPIIRGMIGKDVLLLYNGIRLNKPTFRFGANQYMNTINIESLDRIEVTKGPGSVMYGSDAIGGVVNMISELSFDTIPPSPFHLVISSRYATADQARIVHAAWQTRQDKLILAAGLGAKKFGDLTAGGKIGRQHPTGYWEWNANAKLGWLVNSTTTLELDALTVQQDRVPRFDKYVTKEFLPGDYQTYLYDPQDRYLFAMTLRSQPMALRWVSSIKWNWSYQFEAEGTIEQKTGSSTVTRNRNDLTTIGTYLQVNSIWNNRHVLSYGYEFYWDNIHSRRVQEKDGAITALRGDYPDGSRYRSFGLFVNDDIVFSPQFDLTVGLRWSYVALSSNLKELFGKFEDEYHDWTGTAGISYKPALGVNLIARYAKGFRAPNFNDTVVLKVSNAGVDAPSPGLLPETSHNTEIGVKFNQQLWSGSLFIFYNRIFDLIDRYRGNYQGLDFYDENGNGIRDVCEADVFQKRNVAKGYITGWEVDGMVQISPRWNVRGWAFWTYGQDVTFDEPLSRIPPLMGLAGIQFLPSNRISIEAFIRTAAKQDRLSNRDIDDNRIPYGGTPGWTTANLRCTASMLDRLTIHLIVENLLDETYKEHGSGVYSPGRSLVMSLRYEI